MALHSEIENREKDPVSISIGEMLNELSSKSAKPCISRVPNFLRQVNKEAYEPQAISIGPYYDGENRLEAMEELKIRFLQKLLEEREDNDVSAYVMKIRDLESKARKCYADPLNDQNSDDFVKVLLVDGVFIVQMIRLSLKNSPSYLGNMVANFSSSGFYLALHQDMLLLKNQLPFFVLWELFHLIENSAHEITFMEAIFDMLCGVIPGKELPRDEIIKSLRFEEIHHLLDFAYHCCCYPSTSQMKDREKNQPDELKFIRCATELQEAGIKFKSAKGNTMFDIRFENGTLHIPKIVIEDRTEPFLRNLIAYEQLFFADRDVMHASDYVVFMDYLIDSPKDVEILCHSDIVKNMLGNDQAVATMINRLCVCISLSCCFYYTEVMDKVNTHCSRRCNRWMANLNHNYFNSPWALLSVLAAALLLLLTILQTVFSILSCAK